MPKTAMTRLNATDKTQWIGLLIAILLTPSPYIACLLTSPLFWGASEWMKQCAFGVGAGGMLLNGLVVMLCMQNRSDERQAIYVARTERNCIVLESLGEMAKDASHLAEASPDGKLPDGHVALTLPVHRWENIQKHAALVKENL